MMKARLLLVKLFSRKIRAEEEVLSRQYKVNEEMARKRFVRDMDVMSAVVITKSNRKERGPDELRNGDWWTDGRISKLGRNLHQEKAEAYNRCLFFYVIRLLPVFTHADQLSSRRTIFHSASLKTHS